MRAKSMNGALPLRAALFAVLGIAVMGALLLSLRGIAAASAPPGHFEIDGGMGVVVDTKTGLVWQRFAQPPRKNLAGATTYCQTLDLGGIPVGTWRIPSIRELATIYDPTGTLPPLWDMDVFGDSGPGQIWSVTPDVTGTNGEIWILDVAAGDTSSATPATTQGVLCVH